MIESFKEYGARAAQVSLGEHHTVILTDDGEVLTCGVGEYGLQGTGHTTDALVPVSLDTLEKEDIKQVAAGLDHTLVLTDGGAIFSWGRNTAGQLGHADSYIDIYSMEDYPRLIDEDSYVSGENEETLREDGEEHRGRPVFVQVAAGSGRSAAVTSDGLLYVWGSGMSNQPKLVGKKQFNGKKVVKVAIGGRQGRSGFAVITEDGALWTIGDSKSHILGVKGLSGKVAVPVPVQSLGNKVQDVACGYGQHMLAFVKMEDSNNQ
jgi:alpha-tubulin suppressor-like RCC1 family protein